jgi:hypothetical protein
MTYGSLGTGVLVSDGYPFTTVRSSSIEAGVECAKVIVVAADQPYPKQKNPPRGEEQDFSSSKSKNSKNDSRLVPTTVSWVTVLPVPSSSTPLRILLLHLLSRSSSGDRGRGSDGSESSEGDD